MLFLDVLTQAGRLAGVLKGPGRGLSGSEQQEFLHVANAIIDSLKIERCFVYHVIRSLMPVTTGQQDYSVGALEDGADWVIERPEKIYRAGFIVPASSVVPPTASTVAEIEIDVLEDYTLWQKLICKQVTASQPRVLYYRATLPTGTASVWPIPQVPSLVTIYTPGQISEFTDVNQDILWPKGYREFLEYAIACGVNDRYPEVKMNPKVEMKAREYKSRVMANQWTPALMRCDDGALQGKSDGKRFFDARTWVP